MDSSSNKFHMIPKGDGMAILVGTPSHSKIKTGGHPCLKPAGRVFPFNERDFGPDFSNSEPESENRIMDMDEVCNDRD